MLLADLLFLSGGEGRVRKEVRRMRIRGIYIDPEPANATV